MEELEKCLESTQNLKRAAMDQQKAILALNWPKLDKNQRQCPMCEIIFDNIEYEKFEQHVIEHFVTENAINSY